MAAEIAQIGVGSPVLFFGKLLTVHVCENGLVKCRDAAGDAERLKQRERIVELRKQQEKASKVEHAKLAKEIEAASAIASAAMFEVGLRADLLSYWPEKEVWVSDGRILSDEQTAKWTGSPAKKVPPDQQRKVLLALEAME